MSIQKDSIKNNDFEQAGFKLVVIEVQLIMFEVNILRMSYLLHFVALVYFSIFILLGCPLIGLKSLIHFHSTLIFVVKNFSPPPNGAQFLVGAILELRD